MVFSEASHGLPPTCPVLRFPRLPPDVQSSVAAPGRGDARRRVDPPPGRWADSTAFLGCPCPLFRAEVEGQQMWYRSFFLWDLGGEARTGGSIERQSSPEDCHHFGNITPSKNAVFLREIEHSNLGCKDAFPSYIGQLNELSLH